jgi:RNA recognition motif-containing protein
MPHAKESHMNMYVGNLAYNVTVEDLTESFSEFGTVESVNIIKDRFSGQSKGFGFVDMPDNSEADKAIKALNGTDFKGRDIKVNQANQKTKGKKNNRRPRY